jgi:hypothetical protein
MPVFNVAGQNIPAGAVRTRGDVTPGENFDGASIQLVDSSGDWPDVPDPTRHVRLFGLQQSFDGGTNWEWGPVWIGHPTGDPNVQFGPGGVDYWMPFGHRRRDGSMPGIAFSSSQITGLGTTHLRLAIYVDSAIRLGAQIVTQRDGN